MHLKTYNDPREFQKLVLPHLVVKEAENCLAIGIIDTLVRTPSVYPEFYLAAAFDQSGNFEGASWMTPPHSLGIVGFSTKSLPKLINYVRALPSQPPAVVGSLAIVEEFRDLWLADSRCEIQVQHSQRIYELTKVNHPEGVPGSMRLATLGDEALLEEWSLCFSEAVGMGNTQGDAKEIARIAIENKNRYFWIVDGKIVSMAGASGNTPSGIRINWVYTPPTERRHGYAAALVAALSQHHFNAGKKFCFLYTDLGNPTSNSIYQKIGYRPVCDSMHCGFSYKK